MGTTLVCTVNIVCSVLSTDNVPSVASEWSVLLLLIVCWLPWNYDIDLHI